MPASKLRSTPGRWCRRRAVAVALLATTGCSGAIPRAPSQPSDDASFEPPAGVVAPGLPDDPPVPFSIRPGDGLHLRTVSVDPLDVPDLTVDATGSVHVPLAGDVGVGGLGLGEAEKRIETALHPHDRFARVSLSLTAASGHRATVVGAVEHPGLYELRPETRVAEVMVLAGGPRSAASEGELVDLADLEAARVVRDGATLPVSVGAALMGDPRHNVRVRAGDLVYVPPARGRLVSVLGEVQSPKNILFHAGMRLTEALAAAGGATKDADEADVRVVRGSLARPRVYRASLKAVVAGKGGDVELAAGDVVFVTEHWFASATNVVNRLTPLLAASALTATLVRAKK